MNKKLLFGIMSLAALAACTNDDFESKNVAETSEAVSPIQFEVINDNVVTRASMDGNSIVWNANDGDIFTLYHGGTLGGTALSGYQNAIYKANANEGGTATLTTPSMIKAGRAIMVWPADTVFKRSISGNLAITIPEELTNVENNIPYASDLITIEDYAAYSETAAPGVIPTAYKTAGKDRKYAVYMRPMASQLILKADYAGTDADINALTTGDDPINPIALTSVEINDPTNSSLTKEIDLSFATPAAPQGTNWNTVANNVWTEVTAFDISSAVGAAKLTTKCINGIESAKFLMLPQNNIGATGLTGADIVVNTIYGKVAISAAGGYTPADLADAWYRYAAPGAGAGTYTETETTTAGTGSDASKVRYTNTIEKGLAQVIDAFSTNTTKKATSVVVGEPTGAAGTRYVKVLLSKLDMSDLHIKTDKQLRDVARVWQKMNLGDVTVYLDGGQEGDATGEFSISQKTIKVINDINAAVAGGTKSFKVMPCHVDGEKCTNIVITGASDIQTLQDIAFIEAGDNGTKSDASDDIKANVVLANETNAWKWNVDATTKVASIKVQASAVTRIINKGSILNDADATLKTLEKDGSQNNVPLQNVGKWNVKAGKLFVQFTVSNTNGGELTIQSGAEYRQDGLGHIFYNWANEKPTRFGGDDTKNGKVTNKGVFATVNNGQISNFGLIEHADPNAKTYITYNQSASADFATAFNSSSNKMGRINLPFSNKNEDNISINGSADKGFVSVTVKEDDAPTDGILNADVVGERVNYIIVEGGISSIARVSEQIKYVEINEPRTEVIWDLEAPKKATYEGLMVLSPVNIKLNTEIQVKKACYLGADMYVGGAFNNGTAGTLPAWSGYYGDTSSSFATMYVTY